MALSAARDLGLHGLPIVGLAKERENVTGEKVVERVYLPGQKNGIPLRPGSTALFFLARIRDEAHRFANFARKRLGKKARLRSQIDDIPGLGSAKKTLLRELGSMQAVRAATDEQILAVKGITKRHLTALRKVVPMPELEMGPDLEGEELPELLEGELPEVDGEMMEGEAEGILNVPGVEAAPEAGSPVVS